MIAAQNFPFAIALMLAVGAGGATQPGFAADSPANPYFIIRVVDAATGRGVPLVELETVNHVVHVTDSAGIVAFNEPEFMDREVYFHVQSHGYEYPKDVLGNRGLKLTPRAGTSATVKVKRLNIAERLYRVTGAGIYRDSVLAGLPVPLRHPLLNADVLGQDTVIVTPYRGKLYWFWGDTDQVSYPLGNFAAAGATSELPGRGGLDPSTGVDLTYFAGASGFARAMCPDFGPGLHWIESVMTVPDETGAERLVARVSSQKGLVMPYAWHFAVFNDEKQIFESKARWEYPDMHDSAHPFRARVDGVEHLYLYPNYRVKADLQSLSDPTRYEAFTCVAGDGKLHGANTSIDRDVTGAPRYTWKRGADRLYADRINTLIAAQRLQPAESWLHLRDFDTGAPMTAGRGSAYWNEFRQRWVMLMGNGPGEIWFAEGDTPMGPWGYARRVVAHQNYNFYNPTQHPFFDQEGGRVIFFEGTYTESFSAAKSKTPRYDYNQIMYRLALDDGRLALPRAIYRVATETGPRLMRREDVASVGAWSRIDTVVFYAAPAGGGGPGLIPVHQNPAGRLAPGPGSSGAPLFFALPVEMVTAHGIAGTWLWRVAEKDGDKIDFEVQFQEHDGEIRAANPDRTVTGGGTFTGDKLTLTVIIDDRNYDLAATLHEGALQGTWARDDLKVSGTWSAQWQDPTPPEFRSSAVVPLYEYHDAAHDLFAYSTDPSDKLAGYSRRAEPICRVWKSPSATPVFDRHPIEVIK